MGDYFEVKEPVRSSFINMSIISHLQDCLKEQAEKRTLTIANSYVGRDADALSVLAYAAERARFNEFAQKLETHLSENLAYVHPEARRNKLVPGAIRADKFFLKCYDELEVIRSL